MNPTAIDSLLPQTQCTRCGYPDCLAYAKAIAEGSPHNQCPPGGKRVIAELSDLLKRPPLALNPNNGKEQPKVLAFIREQECIGCTKCIQACPVDAIIGSAKQMHTVITDQCTGCMLCVEPCPVDCISLIEAASDQQPELMDTSKRIAQSNFYREKHANRNSRLEKLAQEKQAKHQALKQAPLPHVSNSTEAKKAYIAQALLRAKAKRKKYE
jgi:electron transport complex protein RnfB